MKTLHELTLEVAAFLSWPEFAEAMDKGYVPTLRTEHPSPEPEDAEFNQSVSELANRLEQLGWSVFRGPPHNIERDGRLQRLKASRSSCDTKKAGIDTILLTKRCELERFWSFKQTLDG